MWKKILLAFLIAVAVVVGLIAMQPASYTVTRTATIPAPPAVVFDNVNDFHKWQAWSPWAKIDPAMKQTYSGPDAGVGATYNWSGNSDAGEGQMVIIESAPNDHVIIHLMFTKPYTSSSALAFTTKPDGAGTAVTWTMTGQNNFMLKTISLFSSMDKMVGPDFEKGLNQLKTVSSH